VPFPFPDGVTVHHAAALVAVQAELEVTLKLVLPAGALTFWLAGVTAKVGELPDCVTVTTTAVTPVPETVMFATRDVGNVLAV
jgi:hypothetical protein